MPQPRAEASDADYLGMGGKTIARLKGEDEVSYLHQDHLGSPVAATDETGAVLWRESYTPFGESLNDPLANKDNENFTGHVRDAQTGLIYMQARYMDPVVGRFLSNDPVGFASGGVDYFNRYAYTANDPVNNIDPFGLSACPADDENCIDDPATETGAEEQDGPDDDTRVLDEIVVTAHRTRRFTNGGRIRFPRQGSPDEFLEQGFRVGPDGIVEQDFTEQRTRVCSDGSSDVVNTLDVSGLGAGQSIGHTHGGRGLLGTPGPEDFGAAAITGRTAYQFSSRGAFALERTAVGFRARQIAGRSLRSGERRNLQRVIAAANQNNGGSGKSCRFTD